MYDKSCIGSKSTAFAQRFLKIMAGWEQTRRPTQRTTIANNSKFEKSHCKSVKMRKDSITQQLPGATAAVGTSSTCNNFLYKTYQENELFPPIQKHSTGYKFSSFSIM
jgi:hypothetical protein